MNKNINKSKIYMIICICMLCISILGTSIAYYRKVLFEQNASTITYGLDYYINYAKGQDISGVELNLSSDYTTGNSSDIELWKKDNTYGIYGHIYLDINEMSSSMSKSSALKYTLVNNGNIISEGSLKGSSAGDSLLVSANIPLQTTRQLYTIYIWVDENEDVSNLVTGETLSLTVRCEATMKPIEVSVNLLEHITKLYTDNYDSTKNVQFADDSGMNYYAPNARLMNDGLDSTGDMVDEASAVAGTAGNIRYYGADDESLKNYIYFNCSDYSNQSSSTCETWRIIGIVDGKVKLIRNSSLGNYAYDYTSTGEYDNNWSDATLNTLLNTTYYNSDSTTYYKGNTTGTTVDFSTNGITAATRNANLISESTWYTNGMSDSDIYANASYKGERTGTSTYLSNIGLAYPSDYGYSADLNTCTNSIYNYEAEECTNSNWLTTMFTTDDSYWLITPHSDDSGCAWNVEFGCVYLDGYFVRAASGVVPVLYLNSELTMESGHEGTSIDPYRISIS